MKAKSINIQVNLEAAIALILVQVDLEDIIINEIMRQVTVVIKGKVEISIDMIVGITQKMIIYLPIGSRRVLTVAHNFLLNNL